MERRVVVSRPRPSKRSHEFFLEILRYSAYISGSSVGADSMPCFFIASEIFVFH